MGPGHLSEQVLPTRPTFYRDIRCVPWRYGVGNQPKYAKEIARCCLFHDILPENNRRNMSKQSRGICLLSNWFDREEYFVSSIEKLIRDSDDSVKPLVECIYKRVPLSVVSLVLSDHQKVQNTKCGPQ